MRLRRLTLRKKIAVAAILAAVVGVITYRTLTAGRFFGDGNLDVVVEKEVILKKVPGMDPASVVFSDDGKRYAYTVKSNKKARVVVDGVEGPEYDEAGRWSEPFGAEDPTTRIRGTLTTRVSFSPGGKRIAYIAKHDGRFCAVIDGIEGSWYDNVGFTLGGWGNERERFYVRMVLFRGSEGHYLYSAERDGKQLIVFDGVEGRSFDEVSMLSIACSADGKHIAYAARRGDKWLVVANGKESGGHDEVSPHTLQFSPDLAHLVYAARDGGKWAVILDGDAQGMYDRVNGPAFSTDSRMVTYKAKVGECHFFVSNGVESPRYDSLATLERAPDGTPTVYAFRKNSHWFLKVDGVETAVDAAPTLFIRSPDGKRSAWIAASGDPQFVVVDGRKGRLYDHVDYGSFRFSPDGLRFAYGARSEDRLCAVVGDAEEGPYVCGPTPRFTPDGKHVFYRAIVSNWRFVRWFERVRDAVGLNVPQLEERQKAVVVVDGTIAGKYETIYSEGISCLDVTPDGRHLVYIAKKQGKEYVFVDGVRKAECPPIDNARIISDSWYPLWYLARDNDDSYYRVTVRLVEN